ncbi:nuclease-related domain-containing protein [Shewanella algae]|uniref:nuclease-related domain-containing protein n=1 Tax=Shewanella algae TaxID=38313 RepID=UPI00313BD124
MKAYWITVVLGICLSFATIAPKVAIAQEVAASTIEAQDGGSGSLLITEISSPAVVLSGTAEAYEQYTQATCLLIRHEMGERNPDSARYLELSRNLQRHCQSPIILDKAPLNISGSITNAAPRVNYSSAHPQRVEVPVAGKPQILLSLELKWFLVALLLAAGILGFPFWRRKRENSLGENGEEAIAQCIRETLVGGNFKLYRNILLQTADGDETEIDLLLLTVNGILVIESKNYSGWIFADPYSKHWVQHLYRSKCRFQNPLHQNYKHCLAVAHILGTNRGIRSLVVFGPRASFKTAVPQNVIQLAQLDDYLQGFRQTLFTEDELMQFELCLQQASEASTVEARERHIARLKSRRIEPSL